MSNEKLSEVHRLLGACLLEVQAIELLFKQQLNSASLNCTTTDQQVAKETLTKQQTKHAVATLGGLTSGFINEIVQPELAKEPEEFEEPEPTAGMLSFRRRIRISDADHQAWQQELRDMVKTRNELVHHFLDRFDLASPEGCDQAIPYLREYRTQQIEPWLRRLQDLEKSRLQVYEYMKAFLESDAGIRWFDYGIAPDGRVHDLATCSAIQLLHEAITTLPVTDGWTEIKAAEHWLAQHHPKATPAAYGYRSWRQIMHESKLFQLVYRQDEQGKKIAWFKPQPAPALKP